MDSENLYIRFSFSGEWFLLKSENVRGFRKLKELEPGRSRLIPAYVGVLPEMGGNIPVAVYGKHRENYAAETCAVVLALNERQFGVVADHVDDLVSVPAHAPRLPLDQADGLCDSVVVGKVQLHGSVHTILDAKGLFQSLLAPFCQETKKEQEAIEPISLSLLR